MPLLPQPKPEKPSAAPALEATLVGKLVDALMGNLRQIIEQERKAVEAATAAQEKKPGQTLCVLPGLTNSSAWLDVRPRLGGRRPGGKCALFITTASAGPHPSATGPA
jgi:hypothetical protein